MDNYLVLKLIHILSASILAGTGTGIAFFMFKAYRSNDLSTIAITARHVVLADWIFTTPAVITQFITGILLMKTLNYSFTSTWFYMVISLFIFIGLCWIPVVVIQYKLKSLAQSSLSTNTIDPKFKRLMSLWALLGLPAFLSVMIIFWLMVFKPLPVV